MLMTNETALRAARDSFAPRFWGAIRKQRVGALALWSVLFLALVSVAGTAHAQFAYLQGNYASSGSGAGVSAGDESELPRSREVLFIGRCARCAMETTGRNYRSDRFASRQQTLSITIVRRMRIVGGRLG